MSYDYLVPQLNNFITQSAEYAYSLISGIRYGSSRIKSERATEQSEYVAKLERGFKQMEEGKLQYHDLIEDNE